MFKIITKKLITFSLNSSTIQPNHQMKLIEHLNIVYKIGSNAQDNFDIIDQSNPQDIWFHVEGRPSCHVVASVPDNMTMTMTKKEKHKLIKKGAELCKIHSKYKSEKNLKIVYTKVENITKTETLGSVLLSNEKIIEI
jgi:predicted ribosome quality control (RQC) complex YloA/Tae2 family protein